MLCAVKTYIFSEVRQMKKKNKVNSVNSFIEILVCPLTYFYPFFTKIYLPNLPEILHNEYFLIKLV